MSNLSKYVIVFTLGFILGVGLTIVRLNNNLLNEIMGASLPTVDEIIRGVSR